MVYWYYSRDGVERVGPVSSHELRALAEQCVVTPESQVWREGMPRWERAEKVRGLFPAVGAASLPPMLPSVGVPTNEPRAAKESLGENEAFGGTRSPTVSGEQLPTGLRVQRRWWTLNVVSNVIAWPLIALVVLNIERVVIWMDEWQRHRGNGRSTMPIATPLLQTTDTLTPETEDHLAPEVGGGEEGVIPALNDDASSASGGAITFKGLTLGLTPEQVSAVAPKVNTDAEIPKGGLSGFWPQDLAIPPVPSLPSDATGFWYFGYSIPSDPSPPAKTCWDRHGWVVVRFDSNHMTTFAAIKVIKHYGPVGPLALPLTDLSPAEYKRQIVDAYDIPELVPTETGNGWEYVNRDEGWKVGFSCQHWTGESSGAGVSSEVLKMDPKKLAEFIAADMLSYADFWVKIEKGKRYAALDTAWMLLVTQTTKSSDLDLD